MNDPGKTDMASPAPDAVAQAAAREAALREILDLISRSRDDEGPVFATILERAAQLCEAHMADLELVDADGAHLREVATWGASARATTSEHWVWPMDSDFRHVEAVRTGQVVHDPDIRDSERYRSGHEMTRTAVDAEGVRAFLAVPLMADGQGIGAILLFRQEPRPFTPDEIALVETFAAQAVIAIENVRQFREVQARLAREQASAEVLAVISQSRDDDAPVFEAILERAQRLCDAQTSGLQLLNAAGTHLVVTATAGLDRGGFKPGFEIDLTEENGLTFVVRTGKVYHLPDLRETGNYRAREPNIVKLVEGDGVLSQLIVPLMQHDKAIGTMTLSRLEQKAFTPDDIALVETFARQAVIAIENVRQFREVQARLERERASAEVLGVISRSRDDTRPVFEAILKAAAQLCEAPLAFLSMADESRSTVTIPAHLGVRPAFAKVLEAFSEPMDRTELVAVRPIVDGAVIHEEDIAEGEAYKQRDPRRVQMVEVEGARTALSVPLIANGLGIGAIVLYRREVKRFDADQVQLVETFAAQAVIAIENVRQFREVQERLERERATSEVLSVISTSRDDDQPVFDVILENAARLCGASNANLTLVNDARDAVRLVASRGRQILSLIVGESEWKLDEAMSVAEALTSGRPIHIPDYAETPSYLDGSNKLRIRLVDEDKVRASLAVPLVGAEGPIGTLMLHRDEPGAFSEAEISLVTAFAAQAVIAIENVRTFNALEALNAELGERVEEQVGEIERMGKLKRFLPSAVADTVVAGGNEKLLTSHRALIAVLFADIRGFTAFCEQAEPEETIELLQTYQAAMGEIIAASGAGVDQRYGDGIMVIFNDPVPCEDPAGAAVAVALAMQARMAVLCAQWKRLGHRLGFGVGLSLGYATVGLIGVEGRTDYAAAGTAVNLAARLCDRAEDGEILLSARAATAVEDEHRLTSIGELEFKGFRAPVEAFRLEQG